MKNAYEAGWDACKMQILYELWKLSFLTDEAFQGTGLDAREIRVVKNSLLAVSAAIPKIPCPKVSER